MGSININRSDLIWSYLGTFFRLGVNIVLLPFVLHYLSDDDLGLWYVFGSINALVALLDFGFAPALSRNISYVWCGARELKKNSIIEVTDTTTDFVYFKTVLLTCKHIYLVIATIAFVILIGAGTPYIIAISNKEAIIPWFIYSTGVLLNILYSYYSSFLRGVGAVAQSNKAAVYSRFVQIALTLPLLLAGTGLIGVSISYLCSGIALRLYSRFAFLKYEGIGNSIKDIVVSDKFKKSIELFRIVWHNASKDGLVTLSNFLSTQANTLISSAVIGLSTTGSYGIAVQFASVISTLAFVPFTTNHPLMQEKSIQGDTKGSKSVFATSIILYCILFVMMSIGLILLRPVIIWLKPSFDLDLFMLLVLLVFYFIYNLYHLFCSYISTFNTVPYYKSFVITAFFSVTLSFIMAKYFDMGLWALIVAPLLASIAYNAWKWPVYVFNSYLHISLIDFCKLGYIGAIAYVKKMIKR